MFEIVQNKKMGEHEKAKTLNPLIGCERNGKEQSRMIFLITCLMTKVVILEMETQEEKQDRG